MINLDEILEKNKAYVAKHPELADKGLTSHPTKKLAIVTCMDTRLVGMLEDALGFERGEIITIKTAGNSCLLSYKACSLLPMVWKLKTCSLSAMKTVV